MENLDLIKDTIIEEALTFCDDLEPVPNSDEILLGIEIGEMSEFEKRLYTLSVLKDQEMRMMFENIIGKNLEGENNTDWIKPLSKIISTDQNFHYYEKFNRLEKEVDACKELMWLLIHLRFHQQQSVLAIRPGYKIIALQNSEEAFIPGNALSGLN